MSLKILIFPTCIILTLILIIGYIKPDISSILQERANIAQKQSDLDHIDTIIQNIRTLNSEISDRKEGEAFVTRFLPMTLDQEHTVDVFNYLASQSGVAVTEVRASENQPIVRVVPEVVHASVSFEALKPATVDFNVPTASNDFMRSYEAGVTAIGSYESIKDFLNRLYRVDRLHQLKNFSIAILQKEDSTNAQGDPLGAGYSADFLKVKFDADFPHFAPFNVTNALDIPTFQTAKFDFSAITDLSNLVNNPLPSLEPGQTGKANPFQ